MTRLKRGGREIVVREEDVAAYLSKGYAVIDNRGNVITEGEAMDFPAAVAKIGRLEAYIAGQTKTLEAANARIKELEVEREEFLTDAKKLKEELDKLKSTEQTEAPGASETPKDPEDTEAPKETKTKKAGK